MHKITPFRGDIGQFEEAMTLDASAFRNAKVLSTSPGPGGSQMSATLEIEGQHMIIFNGGSGHTRSPAVSLYVNCETQE